jgi:hypothetical protein
VNSAAIILRVASQRVFIVVVVVVVVVVVYFLSTQSGNFWIRIRMCPLLHDRDISHRPFCGCG